jgi:hypothetical protein
MMAWLLLNLVETLCNRSWRILAIWVDSVVIFVFSFFQLAENLTFLASCFYNRLIFIICLSVLIGLMKRPFDSVNSLFTPKLPPMIVFDGCAGCAISCST